MGRRTGGTLADYAAVAVVVADGFEIFDGEVGVPLCIGLGDVVKEAAGLRGWEVALGGLCPAHDCELEGDLKWKWTLVEW